MKNPGGKEFSRGPRLCFRKERRDRRAGENPRLKSAHPKEEPPPWSPKDSPSPSGPGPAENWGWANRPSLLTGETILCESSDIRIRTNFTNDPEKGVDP